MKSRWLTVGALGLGSAVVVLSQPALPTNASPVLAEPSTPASPSPSPYPRPDAVIFPASGRFLTGEAVTLTATIRDPSLRYEWSADDGPYQAGDASFTTSWSTPGLKKIGLHITRSSDGHSSTDQRTYEVVSRGFGTPGISINGGNPYTNTKNVTVDLQGWPNGATELLLSNDGGFRATTTMPLGNSVLFTLDDSIAGAYTKVVYVRFGGFGLGESATYSDDIIFDNAPPVVTQVTATKTTQKRTSTSSASAMTGRNAGASTWRVTVKATDRISGVRDLQVRTSQGGPVRTYPYKTRSTISATGKTRKRLLIRVGDNAANWTGWKKARIR